MAKNKKATEEKKEGKEGSKLLSMLIVISLVLIWLAFFGFLIKIDVGGFGSGILRPILKDVPIVNLILPSDSNIKAPTDKDLKFRTMSEATAMIKELQSKIDELTESSEIDSTTIEELRAELVRLQVFEETQNEFEDRVAEFDKNVVFSDKAPDLAEYKAYYEAIDPANAEEIYRQVVEQLQFSDAIKEKADIYRSMEPDAAAKILETMTADIQSVAQILLSMKPKESAAILAEMDNVAAAKITKMMLDMDEELLN